MVKTNNNQLYIKEIQRKWNIIKVLIDRIERSIYWKVPIGVNFRLVLLSNKLYVEQNNTFYSILI